MGNINLLKSSNFLKKEDCGPNGILVTIDRIEHLNVAKEGAPEELKYCMFLKECERPMVLNSTNGQIIAQITGQEDWDNWSGARIVLYNDPTVSFGGKLMGGIRVRAPRGQAAKVAPKPAPAPAPSPAPSDEEADSQVPF